MTHLKNVYCAMCRRFLAKEDIRKGKVEIKCPNCGRFTEVSVQVVIEGGIDKRLAKQPE